VAELVHHGHDVAVQKGAGVGSGIPDADYIGAGGEIVESAGDIWSRCDLVVKVKEPLASERQQLRPGQALFTYLHLAPDPEQTEGLLKSDCVGIAYETVTGRTGGLPLLKPMSQVAGRMAIQAGATALEKAHGGRGVLLGGVRLLEYDHLRARLPVGTEADVVVVAGVLGALPLVRGVRLGRLLDGAFPDLRVHRLQLRRRLLHNPLP
jgi:alanine dehydrogenase